MDFLLRHLRRFTHILLFGILAILPSTFAQEARTGPTKEKADDVVTINSELVQTDVVVLDKDGRFVAGLRPEQLELRVHGKLYPISFFDRITAGSASEEAQLAAARGRRPATTPGSPIFAFDRGRTIFFFLDDCHLSTNSITHVRNLLSQFLDDGMGQDDEVAIITATGQLGFLEQLTNDRAVLQRAITKLARRNFQATDAERTSMSESEALAIIQEDRRILDYFVEQLLKEMAQPRPRQPSAQSRTRSQVETMVRMRAKSIIEQSSALTAGMLLSLERLIRLSARLPWRKSLFFISDGFMLNDRSNPGIDLSRVADAAARSTTVIYSIDARGLVSGTTEAARKMAFDNTGRLVGANSGALSVTWWAAMWLCSYRFLETGSR